MILSETDSFFKKMSILSDGRCVPDGTYLCADVMPMIYIESFDEFINEYINPYLEKYKEYIDIKSDINV